MRGGKLIYTIFTFATLRSGAVLAQCNSADAKHPGYIVGTGEGIELTDAKAKAIADAMGFFQTKVVNESVITEDNEQAYLNSTTVIRSENLAKGAEVLSQCENNGRHRIIIGLRKALLRELIKSRAQERKNFVDQFKGPSKTTGNELYKIAKYEMEDRKDKEDWILLGYPENQYPTVDFGHIPSKFAAVNRHLVASGDLATATLDIVAARLRSSGVELSETGLELTWQCSLSSGSSIGSARRYKAACNISDPGVDIRPIEINGITNEDNLVAVAKIKVMEFLYRESP